MAVDRLERYHERRNFGSTPEPAGGDAPVGTGRFVVQEHHARRLHWYFRLEHHGVLVSWALPRGVPATPDEHLPAARTEDHPLEYRGRHVLYRRGGDDWRIHRLDPPQDAAREPLPHPIVPMLARLDGLPRDDERYGFEVKWDGIRAIGYWEPGRWRLASRNVRDITA